MELSIKKDIKYKFVFLIYILTLLYLLLFSKTLQRNEASLDYRYNLEFLKEIKRYMSWALQNNEGAKEMLVNVIGNIVLFMPFGVLFPKAFKTNIKLWQIVIYGFLFSLIVEGIQLYTKKGSFDVDDLFLNSIGVSIGFLLYKLFFKQKNKVVNKG